MHKPLVSRCCGPVLVAVTFHASIAHALTPPATTPHRSEQPSSRIEPNKVALQADESAIAATRLHLPNEGRGFLRTETRAFVVLSDAPAGWTRRQAEVLERARHQFDRFTARLRPRAEDHTLVHPLTSKLVCVLFQNHDDFRAFAAREDQVQALWVAGYYSSRANRVVFYNDETSADYQQARATIEANEEKLRTWRAQAELARKHGPSEKAVMLERAVAEAETTVKAQRQRLERQSVSFGTSKTIHEAIHLLAFNTGLQRRDASYPFWVSEGLATTFEASDTDGSFGPGREGSKSNLSTWRDRAAQLKTRADAGDLEWEPMSTWIDRVAHHGGLAGQPEIDPERAALGVEASYARAAVLFDWLVRYRRAELSKYLVDLAARPIMNPRPGEHAQRFIEHFGDPDSIERRAFK